MIDGASGLVGTYAPVGPSVGMILFAIRGSFQVGMDLHALKDRTR